MMVLKVLTFKKSLNFFVIFIFEKYMFPMRVGECLYKKETIVHDFLKLTFQKEENGLFCYFFLLWNTCISLD